MLPSYEEQEFTSMKTYVMPPKKFDELNYLYSDKLRVKGK